ncbi:MAG: tetratricopeptide repeat protein [Verrucomicrobia bacterium]|nr:tetratricopeptide repeat protein [Verrucomicrobiota bacterium]
MFNSGETLRNAMTLFGENKIDGAAQAFERVLQQEPNHSVALHFLGLCRHRQGQGAAALELLLKSIAADPHQAAFHSNLGLFYAERNELERAEEAFANAIRLDSNCAQTHTNLGNVLQRKGRVEEAIQCFRAALRVDPGFAHALNNLAGALASQGQTVEAVATFEKALAAAPSVSEIHFNLGNLYLAEGKIDEAMARFSEALRLRPDYGDAMTGLARGFKAKGNRVAAEEQLRLSRRLQPGNPKTLLEFGNFLRESGRTPEALDCFEKAARLDPAHFYAAWNACLALPVIYQNAEEIKTCRERWRTGAERLLNFVETRSHPANARAWFVAPHTNFYLHYQALNDLAEQKRFAQIIARLASQAYPKLTQPIPVRWSAGRRVKVGFVSSFFSLHTVFKLFHGWIKHLRRDLFEIHSFHLGQDYDKATEFIKGQSGCFSSGFRSPDEIIQRIQAGGPDVLIYPDIGMDPLTQSLAALRLAPVQCMSWGHPVTSGLPTIDYFLSSEAMEAPMADSHYSETLVRLPNLSICYPPPDPGIAEIPSGPNDFDLGRSHCLCLQSLFKLLPQYDDLYPRIAARVPNSEFWFIALDSAELTEMFRQRLAQSFSKHGLDAARYVRIFPKMKIGRFFGLIRQADVILDSVGWSGGNTTLEAVAFDKPVVTLPGELMRSRHTYAILALMELAETIAKDLDDYVAIAGRLALDKAWHAQIVSKTRSNKSRVYNDLGAVRGLERFLLSAVGEQR